MAILKEYKVKKIKELLLVKLELIKNFCTLK